MSHMRENRERASLTQFAETVKKPFGLCLAVSDLYKGSRVR